MFVGWVAASAAGAGDWIGAQATVHSNDNIRAAMEMTLIQLIAVPRSGFCANISFAGCIAIATENPNITVPAMIVATTAKTPDGYSPPAFSCETASGRAT